MAADLPAFEDEAEVDVLPDRYGEKQIGDLLKRAFVALAIHFQLLPGR